MRIELCSVWDAAASRYVDPFPSPTLEVAIRGFKEACETEGHQFQKFPEDYSLFHVGSFDCELGVLEGMEARKIATAGSFGASNTISELRDSLSVSEREA